MALDFCSCNAKVNVHDYVSLISYHNVKIVYTSVRKVDAKGFVTRLPINIILPAFHESQNVILCTHYSHTIFRSPPLVLNQHDKEAAATTASDYKLIASLDIMK